MKTYTKNQIEVINISQGHNMVLAGPGCGKTDILTERIAHAYESGQVNLEDAACLTFTNRAARGMFDRIKYRLGAESAELFVGNIHKFSSHFLFDNNVIPSESTIMDEHDTSDVLDSLFDALIKVQLKYSIKEYGISLDWDIVHYLYNIDIYPSGTTGCVKEQRATEVVRQAKRKIYEMQHLLFQIINGHPEVDFLYGDLLNNPWVKNKYETHLDISNACRKLKNNKLNMDGISDVDLLLTLSLQFWSYKARYKLYDFDDLLIHTYNAYLNDSKMEYKRYSWLQIDEIQDLSPFQISLVNLLIDSTADYVVVYFGDEQQAIYSFMGASLSTMSMLKEKCGSSVYRLDKNFRSPKYLLDIYNTYAIKELNVPSDFLPKPKDDCKAKQGDLAIFHGYKIEDEVQNAVNIIKNNGSDARTALLVPWNRDADEISELLKNDYNIPHFKISGLDSFQSEHIKTILSHLNVASNEFNIISWARIFVKIRGVNSYSEARQLISQMREISLTPDDLIQYESNTSYLMEFCDCFDKNEFVVFDTETTGLDVFNDEIVQIAAMKIANGEIVPNSSFNIFLESSKPIPAKLGKIDNPMVAEYINAKKLPRREALKLFMDYIGSSTLIGHNVNYDYNILKNNLKRDCSEYYDLFYNKTFDTLKLSHLLFPRLKKYKLGYLIGEFQLEGANSHMADDDIIATYELLKYCRSKSNKYLEKQRTFLDRKDIIFLKDIIKHSYKECYKHTKELLYKIQCDGAALTCEMQYLSEYFFRNYGIQEVDTFNLILSFIENEVISTNEVNALSVQLSNHLMDLNTFREADMCESSSFTEKIFVSTVHKAKGLEFENVIVMKADVGRYPHFAHAEEEEQEEDKRLFYVAISRARHKLIISHSEQRTPFIEKIEDFFI